MNLKYKKNDIVFAIEPVSPDDDRIKTKNNFLDLC